ncbi:hypothetical protein QYG_1853 [Escherichia coli B7-1]|nr:hypothetical protein QYG_1853 [Escherichia coli B7-1]
MLFLFFSNYHRYPFISGCAWRGFFLRPATGRWSSCDLIPVPAS